jgi:anthraniloyl-CoA monooxygenase
VTDPPRSLRGCGRRRGRHSNILRDRYAAQFAPRLESRANRFVWLGTTGPSGLHLLQAFTARALAVRLPVCSRQLTFIVETADAAWRATGLAEATKTPPWPPVRPLRGGAAEAPSAQEPLAVAPVSHRRNARWHAENVVLLGDAAHTATFQSAPEPSSPWRTRSLGALHRHRGYLKPRRL